MRVAWVMTVGVLGLIACGSFGSAGGGDDPSPASASSSTGGAPDGAATSSSSGTLSSASSSGDGGNGTCPAPPACGPPVAFCDAFERTTGPNGEGWTAVNDAAGELAIVSEPCGRHLRASTPVLNSTPTKAVEVIARTFDLATATGKATIELDLTFNTALDEYAPDGITALVALAPGVPPIDGTGPFVALGIKNRVFRFYTSGTAESDDLEIASGRRVHLVWTIQSGTGRVSLTVDGKMAYESDSVDVLKTTASTQLTIGLGAKSSLGAANMESFIDNVSVTSQ